jgi:hypothetical protein
LPDLVEWTGKTSFLPTAYRIVPGVPSFGCVLLQMPQSTAMKEFGVFQSKNEFKSKLSKFKGKVQVLSIAKAKVNVNPAVITLWLPKTIDPSLFCVLPFRIDVWMAIAIPQPLSTFQK